MNNLGSGQLDGEKTGYVGSRQESLLGLASFPMLAGGKFPASILGGGQPPPTAHQDICLTNLLEDMISDESMFDPPTDDIFDDSQPSLPPNQQLAHRNDHLVMLEETLKEALAIDDVSSNDWRSSPPRQQLEAQASPNRSSPSKHSLSEQEVGATPIAMKRQRISKEDEEDKHGRFRQYQAEQWTEKFQELMEFRGQRGHCNVPHSFDENPSLARWVKRQRYRE